MSNKKVIREAIKLGMHRMARFIVETTMGADFEKIVDEVMEELDEACQKSKDTMGYNPYQE